MSRLDSRLDNEQSYTMRELNQDTAKVLQKINESGKPAVITRYGRFVALITPLANKDVESAVVEAVIQEAAQSGAKQYPRKSLSPEELAEELGIELPEAGQ